MCTCVNSAALIGIIHEGKPTNCYLGKKIEKGFQFYAVCILILRDICVSVCVCVKSGTGFGLIIVKVDSVSPKVVN